MSADLTCDRNVWNGNVLVVFNWRAYTSPKRHSRLSQLFSCKFVNPQSRLSNFTGKALDFNVQCLNIYLQATESIWRDLCDAPQKLPVDHICIIDDPKEIWQLDNVRGLHFRYQKLLIDVPALPFWKCQYLLIGVFKYLVLSYHIDSSFVQLYLLRGIRCIILVPW